MPTGTGKTVCLVSLITSYQFQYPQTGKLIYCTRTVPEMTKCMSEIKRVIEYRKNTVGPLGEKILAVCLSSRRNMCVNAKVFSEGDRETVDTLCRSMTASWVRSKVKENPSNKEASLCSYYESYDSNGTTAGRTLLMLRNWLFPKKFRMACIRLTIWKGLGKVKAGALILWPENWSIMPILLYITTNICWTQRWPI